jgi:hypothetical protein
VQKQAHISALEFAQSRNQFLQFGPDPVFVEGPTGLSQSREPLRQPSLIAGIGVRQQQLGMSGRLQALTRQE